jgi:hypothetical protein
MPTSFLPEKFRQLGLIPNIVKSHEKVKHQINHSLYEIGLPVSFTPFASVKVCSARCQFCSETLIHQHASQLSSSLRPSASYAKQLRTAMRELIGLKCDLSLSGLEATSDNAWLMDVLQAVREHEQHGGAFDDKVLYSNGTGLAPQIHDSLATLHALRDTELKRIEMSRHSPEQVKNDQIMRFRKGVSVAQTSIFEETVRRALNYVPVKLVCVVQKCGVETLDAIEAYLHWAHAMGVDTVVFRELSRLHDLYKMNATSRYVEDASIGIEALVDMAFVKSPSFEPLDITEGYYYWNVKFRWNKKVNAIFETSDYKIMKQLHLSDVIYKLIFHANGNLCADWDPNTRVLMSV